MYELYDYILMCVPWILYFQLKKKIATQGLEIVAVTSAALELDEEEDEEENSGTVKTRMRPVDDRHDVAY